MATLQLRTVTFFGEVRFVPGLFLCSPIRVTAGWTAMSLKWITIYSLVSRIKAENGRKCMHSIITIQPDWTRTRCLKDNCRSFTVGWQRPSKCQDGHYFVGELKNQTGYLSVVIQTPWSPLSNSPTLQLSNSVRHPQSPSLNITTIENEKSDSETTMVDPVILWAKCHTQLHDPLCTRAPYRRQIFHQNSTPMHVILSPHRAILTMPPHFIKQFFLPINSR